MDPKEEQHLVLRSSDGDSKSNSHEIANVLPCTLHMDGDWEVAATELHYMQGNAQTLSQFTADWSLLLYSPFQAQNEKYQIAPSTYVTALTPSDVNSLTTVSDLWDSVDKRILEMLGSPLTLDSVYQTTRDSKGGRITIIRVKKGYQIAVSRNIAAHLGLKKEFFLQVVKDRPVENMIWINPDLLPAHNVSMNLGLDGERRIRPYKKAEPVQSLQIHCDFVQEQIVGQTFQQLLRNVPVNPSPPRSIIRHRFHEKYVPLSKRQIRSLSVSLKGESGQTNLVHPTSDTTLTLSFRPQRKNPYSCQFVKTLIHY